MKRFPTLPEEKNVLKKSIYFSLRHPRPWCPQKISVNSVQPFGRLYATTMYMNVLFYYIEEDILGTLFS